MKVKINGVVLKLILAGKGTNDVVQSHHGLKSNLEDDLPTVPEDSDTERREIKVMLDTVGEIDGFHSYSNDESAE